MSILRKKTDEYVPTTITWKKGVKHIRTTMDLPEKLHKRLSIYCLNEAGPRKRNEILIEIIKDYLDGVGA